MTDSVDLFDPAEGETSGLIVAATRPVHVAVVVASVGEKILDTQAQDTPPASLEAERTRRARVVAALARFDAKQRKRRWE